MPALRHITGDESIPVFKPIPYLGSRQQQLGDTIGYTYYDLQVSCAPGMRLAVDDSGYVHVNWMKMNSAHSLRYCGWNVRFDTGVWYGETQASPSWSGYVRIDLTNDNRTVITYHYNDGSNYFSWIDIDDGQCWGCFGNNMGNNNCGAEQHIWPVIAVKDSNITMVTGDNVPAGDANLHKYHSTDLGQTWAYQAAYDSCCCLSQFLRASENSSKVVYVWTQSIAMEFTGQLISQTSCDIKYELSTDGGVAWNAPVNITNYQPPGTMVNGDTTPVAYCDPCAVFDQNDNLHLAWGVNLVWVHNDTIYYYDRAKIMHWDEISGNITTVSSPSIYYSEPDGWWLDTQPHYATGASGGWRMACDKPQLIVDEGNGDLYCVWHGNDDTTDVGASGFFNHELYGAKSVDNGATWTDYVNLTNTRAPGAGAGACMDEDYMTANPQVVNDSIWLTYIEDKDAGSAPNAEGTYTENPVRVWIFPKRDIGLQEHRTDLPATAMLSITPNPVTRMTTLHYTLASSSHMNLDLYDAAGRLIEQLIDDYNRKGTYALTINTNDLANGTYFVLMETPEEHCTGTLVVVH
jgi:hypothetical protein